MKTRLSIVYLQLKFDKIQNDNSTQTLVFLAKVELKKINTCLKRLNYLIYFKRTDILQNLSNRDKDIPERVNSSKIEVKNFHSKTFFLYALKIMKKDFFQT